MSNGTEAAASRTARSIGIELLVLSILALFCELVVIRWLATEIRIFAYFKNLPLLSVFIGLGLGFIWSNRKFDFYKWSAFGLLYLAGLLTVAAKIGLTYLTFFSPDQFMLWGLYGGNSEALQMVRSLSIMAAVFVLNASIFIGLGQRMGRLFGQLQPLSAYSINVFGGLIGSLLLLVLCFLSTPPGVWLIIAGLLYFVVDKRPVSVALILFGIAYSVYLGPRFTNELFEGNSVKTIWSPYYRIDVVKKPGPGQFSNIILGYNIYINYDSFQSIVDCTPENLARLPEAARGAMLDTLAEPFKILKKPNQSVLVLGSGSGSDVAAALRNGVGHVDAVEIDPAIAELGRELHPEHPYQSPKVSVFVTDARNYLQNCDKKYDVIVFATLDSQAAFSSLSSLRMDNYVFTAESIAKAASLLTPDGIIHVNFILPGDWLWERHSKALANATNSVPLGYRTKRREISNGTLIAGPGIAAGALPESLQNMPLEKINLNTTTEVSTDDWPFLFLPKKEVPSLYVLPLLVMLAISAIPVATEMAKGAANIRNWQMFFLGMAFMLLEVRAMADLSLLFGSTWIINSVIISSVMVVILIANYFAPKVNQRFVPWLLGGVLISLLLSTTISAATLLQLGSFTGGLCGIVMYLFPLIFAAMVFALLYKQTKEPSTALAFNLIGGGVGICLEYLSMWLGVKALGWIGALLYAIVLVLHTAMKARAPVEPVTEASALPDAG